MNKDKLREQLAAIEHERWADWQKYLHSRTRYIDLDEYSGMLIDDSDWAHWERQIKTPYAELSDKEKASDMEQVDRYWHLIEKYAQGYAEEILGNKPDIDWYGFDIEYPVGHPLRQEMMVYYKDTTDARANLIQEKHKLNKELGGKL